MRDRVLDQSTGSPVPSVACELDQPAEVLVVLLDWQPQDRVASSLEAVAAECAATPLVLMRCGIPLWCGMGAMAPLGAPLLWHYDHGRVAVELSGAFDERRNLDGLRVQGTTGSIRRAAQSYIAAGRIASVVVVSRRSLRRRCSIRRLRRALGSGSIEVRWLEPGNPLAARTCNDMSHSVQM